MKRGNAGKEKRLPSGSPGHFTYPKHWYHAKQRDAWMKNIGRTSKSPRSEIIMRELRGI